MAGHLGVTKLQPQNLEVLMIDQSKLIFVKGSVPEKKKSIVKVYK